MANPERPVWRKTFDKVERAVGGRLEDIADTREFADALSTTARVQKGLARQLYGMIHRTLHFFGLSSLKDTRAIARQLNRVEAQLRDVSAQLEALEEHDAAPSERASAVRSPAPSGTGTKPPPNASAKRPAAKRSPADKAGPTAAAKRPPAKKTTAKKAPSAPVARPVAPPQVSDQKSQE